ncbi:MAG: PilZ domain-containing protein, partial [Pseudomonadota bacterium]
MDLEEIFLKFRRLDEEKIGFGLGREDENDWYIYHNIIMTKIFLEPYGALLDKRKFIRVPTALPIEYKIEKEKIHTIIQNIGVGGVSVPLNPRVSVG